MWLLNNPPDKLLQERYGFEPTPGWLEHLQKSCVRIGASGSLVSGDGLLLTNHHVGSDQLFKLSTAERDLLAEGFYARTRGEELKCPDLEVRVLWSIEDVTERINAAATPEMSPADAYTARRKAMTRVEQESKDATGLECEVVTLYHGARYHLYRYKSYKDVRLVMAPEKTAAFFGGDTDNFEYPRFDLDFCFFRVYEDGRPLHPEHYLRCSQAGAADGELAFVLGHPGRTRRLLTVEHLKFLRDVEVPTFLRYLWRREVQLATFCNRGPENARIGEDSFFSVQNSRKARTGVLAGLLDPELFRRKGEEERRLQAAPTSPGDSATQPADPWADIATAVKTEQEFHVRYQLVGRTFGSELYSIARDLVRLAEELPKASPDRLREYRDSELDSLYLQLYSPAPIYEALETNAVASGLSNLAETFGAGDPTAVTALGGLPPAERAEQLVRGCTLQDVETRKRLVKEGRPAIESSTDPMIQFARAMDPEARALRKRFEDEVEGVQRAAYARIGAARFAAYGESVYPDATGTLRLAFGPIKGYTEAGRTVPAFTTLEGMYDRWKERRGQPGFELPQRWVDLKSKLDLSVQLNFVLKADIIGGNSGSPVVNAKGEIVGLIFDGNLQSLIWDIAYDDVQGRALAVDIRAIIEALRKVYNAGALTDELVGD
ncbi:MAG: S46 family peptidase [Planctomycetes bacterium]|nr:S46 family peptidase [Planctomycetota bacterium]